MGSIVADHYRRWFEYEKDAHAKVMASLRGVPEPLRARPEYDKAISLLAHIVAARRVWLFRLGVSPDEPREFFPRGIPLDELEAGLTEMHALWSEFLAPLTDAELARIFEYKSYDAGWFRNTYDDILAQLFGHSWYHRGQIAALVRLIGAEPAVTDFVYWTREPSAGPPS